MAFPVHVRPHFGMHLNFPVFFSSIASQNSRLAVIPPSAARPYSRKRKLT
jgi:hypothetical protein